MADSRQRGAQGEALARDYLQKLGWRHLASNWLCKVGEIDLIMQAGDTRVLVEVRLRAPTRYGAGLDTVAWQKQQKLIRTAKYYQQKERYWGDLRFDVVSIIQAPGEEPQIEHIPHAFDAA
jgi:putative endonuclease